MSTRKLEGGLAASFSIRNRLVGTIRGMGANSALTAQVPFCSGVIPESMNDFSVVSPEDFIKPMGVPGWDTGELPGTSNVVIGFTRGTGVPSNVGKTPNGDFVALNAADVLDFLNNAITEDEAIRTLQSKIDTAQFVPDAEARTEDVA